MHPSTLHMQEAACHCGRATLRLAHPPAEITLCNCSLCTATGVLWAYYDADDVLSLPDPSLTDTYAWNGRHVDFHRCRHCGCVTHWMSRDATRRQRGINARLLGADLLARARVRHKDGAGTGEYLD